MKERSVVIRIIKNNVLYLFIKFYTAGGKSNIMLRNEQFGGQSVIRCLFLSAESRRKNTDKKDVAY